MLTTRLSHNPQQCSVSCKFLVQDSCTGVTPITWTAVVCLHSSCMSGCVCVYFCLCVSVCYTEYIKHLDDSCSDRRIAEGLSTMSTLVAYLGFPQCSLGPWGGGTGILGDGRPQCLGTKLEPFVNWFWCVRKQKCDMMLFAYCSAYCIRIAYKNLLPPRGSMIGGPAVKYAV